jgi:hypothetical protein
MKPMLNRLDVLYKHASSYAFYLIALYETLRLEGVDISWLPRWSVIILAISGPALKLWKQRLSDAAGPK